MGKTDMKLVEKIRDSLEARNAVVELSLPKAPTQEQYVKLYNTFNALTDKDVELEITEDPNLVAGAKARIGDIVLDNSIAAQIDKMRTEVEDNLELRTLGNDD
jgi:F0F1-type ATP synthase delta subunit